MYLTVLATAGLVSALLGAYAWRNRRYPGFAYFAALEAAMVWWIGCYLGEQLDPVHARLWFALKFPAIAAITPSWLIFTLFHIGQRPQLRRWALAYAWPVLLFPLVYTNDAHRLFFTEVVRREELVGLNGPLFSVHLALTYSYVLVAAPLLVRDWQRRGSIQSLLMLAHLTQSVGQIVQGQGKIGEEGGGIARAQFTIDADRFSCRLQSLLVVAHFREPHCIIIQKRSIFVFIRGRSLF